MSNSSRDDVENVAQGNAPGHSGSKVGIVGVLLVLFMFFGLVNLGTYWFGPMLSDSGWIGQFLFHPERVSVDKKMQSSMWPPFRSEARGYVDRNLSLTNLALKKYLSVRDRLRNAGPLGDYVMIRVLRLLGLFSYLFGGFLIVGVFLVEGFKKNAEKRINFQQFSSTTYHFVLRTGTILMTGFLTFYLFIPHKIYIPQVLNMPIPSISYSPTFWAVLVTVGMSYVVFTVTSNFSTNV